MSCESCHSEAPHKNSTLLNRHTDRIACQTCHIPRIARGGNPTLLRWDWSAAGRLDENNRPIVIKDERGNSVYHANKGDLTWGTDIVPEYRWYTGDMNYHGPTHSFDDTAVLSLNRPLGWYGLTGAKIFPFKVLEGKQIYDTEYKTLVVPKLFGKKETGAYWSNYDWRKAAAAGMAEAGLPFSGSIGFAETKTFWPVTHMVAPAEQALRCGDCHSRNGRLADVQDFYLPGRDR